jgi:hypothetical protein
MKSSTVAFPEGAWGFSVCVRTHLGMLYPVIWEGAAAFRLLNLPQMIKSALAAGPSPESRNHDCKQPMVAFTPPAFSVP